MTPNADSEKSYKLYLRDLGYLIRELAVESKAGAAEKQSDFATGYMAGFHRVVSLMQQQAEAFEIPLEELALDDFDPDRELV
jgi:hypothetical protein